jgi:hypothetical protein
MKTPTLDSDGTSTNYIKLLLFIGIVLSFATFIFSEGVLLFLINFLNNKVDIVFIEYLGTLNFRFKVSFALSGIFLLYGGLILLCKPLLEKNSKKIRMSFVSFPIIGILLGISVGLFSSYKELLVMLPQVGESAAIDISSIISLCLENIYKYSALMFILNIFVFVVLKKYGTKTIFIIFLVLSLLISAMIMLIFPTVSLETTSNAIAINDGQVMLLEVSDGFIVIRPLLQTVNMNIKESHMQFDWFYLKSGDGLFKQLITTKGNNVIFESKETKIKDTIIGWSAARVHSGFIYPGGINNCNSTIKAVAIDELDLEKYRVSDIIKRIK